MHNLAITPAVLIVSPCALMVFALGGATGDHNNFEQLSMVCRFGSSRHSVVGLHAKSFELPVSEQALGSVAWCRLKEDPVWKFRSGNA